MKRCADRHWSLLAAHVRTNPVHIVVQADVGPERIMNDLKSYASRCLNRLGLDEPATCMSHLTGQSINRTPCATASVGLFFPR